MTQRSRGVAPVWVCCVLLVGGIVASAAADSSKGASATRAPCDAQPSAYQPTATFQELMDAQVDTASDYIWKAVAVVGDAKGLHEYRPHSAAEWHALRQRATQLVEAANLIVVPGRRVASHGATIEDGQPLDIAAIQGRLSTNYGALVGYAGALREVGTKLVAAADRKDANAIIELGGTLDEVCEACHVMFWYPDQAVKSAR